MVVTNNILCLPLLLIVWLIDGYLLMLLIRWILSRLPQARGSQLHRSISLLADPLPQWLGRQFQRIRPMDLSPTVVWGALIVLLIVTRHILIALVIALD